MDTYQPVYDAVRSRMSHCDIGSAVESAIHSMNLSHYVQMALESINIAGYEHQRPSAVYRPKLYMDGDQWCALYGDDIQTGVCGFGGTPHKAMSEFDAAWLYPPPAPADRKGE